MKFLLKIGVAALALTAAVPASAALVLVPGGSCNVATSTPDAVACAGAYDGNLLNNASIGDLNAALDDLVGGSGSSPDAVWANLDPTKAIFSPGMGTEVEFSQTLLGLNILAVHFGDANTGLGDRTILYLFDFGAGADSVDLGIQGFSDAVQVPSPIPEAATWTMMLLGFGAAGFAIRRRRKQDIRQVA